MRIRALTAAILMMAALPAHADDTPTDRGRAVAVAADCVACHTAADGRPFAGGRPMKTPLGTLYSTNITPDGATGIGAYSFADFDGAVRRGIAKDGHRLYPAMPYPAYAKISDDDMRALYTYFIGAVPAVVQPNRPAGIPWPLSMRWPLAAWNALFARIEPFRPRPDHDARWNRGAYLVEGPGHCGSCHTPRGLAFEEKAMDETGGRHFLAGGDVDGWFAKSLRGEPGTGLGDWSEDEIVQFLKTGRTAKATAFGGMTEVIEHSTQHMAIEDLAAIARYLKSLPPAAPGAPRQSDDTTRQTLAAGDFTKPGAAAYVEHCAICHRVNGEGVAGIFPALAGNSAVTPPDPASAIRITLEGGQVPRTGNGPAFVMPAFARLGDQEVADILTFIRTGWGNRASAVTAGAVDKVRAEAKIPASTPVAEESGPRFAPGHVADIPKSPRGDLIREGLRLLGDTRRLLPAYVNAEHNCTSCHLNGGTVALGSPFVGTASNFPAYAPRAGREITLKDRINGCFLRSMNGKPVPPDSKEMAAMAAYFDWLAEGIPQGVRVKGGGIGKIDPALVADPVNGRRVYEIQCAVCHGKDGEGLRDADGRIVFPALWGDQAFNIGAGMARTYTAAAFVKNNMPVAVSLKGPLGQGGVLSDQEAIDVAEYFSHQPRPDFAAKVKDWPNGGRPKDARY